MFILQTPGAEHGTAELDGKAIEGKDRASSKKTKGTSRNHVLIGGKTVDVGNAASGSGNDVGTQRLFVTDLMSEHLKRFFFHIISVVFMVHYIVSSIL